MGLKSVRKTSIYSKPSQENNNFRLLNNSYHQFHRKRCIIRSIKLTLLSRQETSYIRVVILYNDSLFFLKITYLFYYSIKCKTHWLQVITFYNKDI